jgi:hypothetical protein
LAGNNGVELGGADSGGFLMAPIGPTKIQLAKVHALRVQWGGRNGRRPIPIDPVSRAQGRTLESGGKNEVIN